MTPSMPQPKTRRKRPVEDDGQRLVRAILKLPVRLRDVFLLHRMAGMTYLEIGLHLGMTPKAVEASLAAALVRLTRAIPPSDPSLKSDGEVTRIVASPSQRKACHAVTTSLEPASAYEKQRREFTSDHVRSNPVKGQQSSRRREGRSQSREERSRADHP